MTMVYNYACIAHIIRVAASLAVSAAAYGHPTVPRCVATGIRI